MTEALVIAAEVVIGAFVLAWLITYVNRHGKWGG